MSWCPIPRSEWTWRAVPTASPAAAAAGSAWRRAWHWLCWAVQLFLGRVGVLTYVPVRVARVPRSLRAAHTDPQYRLTHHFLASLRSPPRTPHC